jgi:hypothetical protein
MPKIVFLSYSHVDAKITEQLRHDLGEQGVQVWIDHEQLEPGTPDWDAVIRRGIKASDAVIYLASPDALASRSARGELEVASRFGKLIIPLWVAGDYWRMPLLFT